MTQDKLSGFLAVTTSCYLQDLLSSLVKYDGALSYLYCFISKLYFATLVTFKEHSSHRNLPLLMLVLSSIEP